MRMLELAIDCQWSMEDIFKLRRMQMCNIPPGDGQENYAQFLNIWDKIIPESTFENLPLPKNLDTKPIIKSRVHAANYVNGDNKKLKLGEEAESKAVGGSVKEREDGRASERIRRKPKRQKDEYYYY